MKRMLLGFLLLVIFYSTSYCQSRDPKPGSPIPVFSMKMTNGKDYATKDIPKKKPFVLIYFAPDCDHCIKLMDELFKKIHQLGGATIAMVTFETIDDVAWFERKYQTATYPNIKVGTEGTTYVLRKFYKLEKTPFTAVYDKKGKLAFSYKSETPVKEMLARYKKL